ncbi:TetR/AcrR family transcriptional regulator [Jiangella asiatica]|uniref:TetR/AcrR family transcriptional regulator n=1 Tax=Jiangella asiatica TaxID=2530372 RepID=A0A4V2Z0K4_9ACTN|nr:TetR/AcrR family transcriptional regulator [Jiangella asiatica]TDE01298.1 TetR/AcrR family transcriptional regulator [Jiangella asiatica]
MGATATADRKAASTRTDATRNRERIIAAAREAFVEHGPGVPLDAIAHRAGVGNATLYRHFADRRELVHVVASYSMARVTEQAEAAFAEEPDPFEALRRFVHRAADERVGALCSLLHDGFDKNDPHVVEARERLEASVERLMDNARRSGQLRTDVAIGDLMVAITQLTRPVPGTVCALVERFMHRHLQLFLDGLRTPARSELCGSAVTFEDLDPATA